MHLQTQTRAWVLKPSTGECHIFYDFAHTDFLFSPSYSKIHTYPMHAHTQYPEAIWQPANPTLCACSFTHCFGPLTGLWHQEPARPPWPPSSHHLHVFSLSCQGLQIQPVGLSVALLNCHDNTSHLPTSTLREWVINKPGAICWLSVKSGTPPRYQSSARHQALLSFLPLL